MSAAVKKRWLMKEGGRVRETLGLEFYIWGPKLEPEGDWVRTDYKHVKEWRSMRP